MPHLAINNRNQNYLKCFIIKSRIKQNHKRKLLFKILTLQLEWFNHIALLKEIKNDNLYFFLFINGFNNECRLLNIHCHTVLFVYRIMFSICVSYACYRYLQVVFHNLFKVLNGNEINSSHLTSTFNNI